MPRILLRSSARESVRASAPATALCGTATHRWLTKHRVQIHANMTKTAAKESRPKSRTRIPYLGQRIFPSEPSGAKGGGPSLSTSRQDEKASERSQHHS